jgi:hypothetical protein
VPAVLLIVLPGQEAVSEGSRFSYFPPTLLCSSVGKFVFAQMSNHTHSQGDSPSE